MYAKVAESSKSCSDIATIVDWLVLNVNVADEYLGISDSNIFLGFPR